MSEDNFLCIPDFLRNQDNLRRERILDLRKHENLTLLGVQVALFDRIARFGLKDPEAVLLTREQLMLLRRETQAREYFRVPEDGPITIEGIPIRVLAKGVDSVRTV